jgi:hypothetical protein
MGMTCGHQCRSVVGRGCEQAEVGASRGAMVAVVVGVSCALLWNEVTFG